MAVKYSRNPHLVTQYEAAIENYYFREGKTVYLVIQTAESKETLATLKELKRKAQADGKPVPELLIYDGRLNEITQGILWEIGADDDRLVEATKTTLMSIPTVQKRGELLDQLVKVFGDEDVKELCFQLEGIEYDDLPAQGRRNKLRELISQLERENRIDDLIGICKQERPQYNWNGFVSS